MLLEQRRQMIAKNRAGRGETQPMIRFAAQTRASFRDLAKERFDEFEQFAAGRSERERSPLEKGQSKILLELQDLSAHGRLLNSVRHPTDGFADTTVQGHVIEKFEMMNVHRR